MFQSPLLFLRLQKTQILPFAGLWSAGSKTTTGSRSARPPAVNCLGGPQLGPANRFVPDFQPAAAPRAQKQQGVAGFVFETRGLLIVRLGKLGRQRRAEA